MPDKNELENLVQLISQRARRCLKRPGLLEQGLLSLDNVEVAPHVGWLTNETFSRSIDIAVKNSLAIRDGSTLLHRVI